MAAPAIAIAKLRNERPLPSAATYAPTRNAIDMSQKFSI
jgi:hypothetical protein